MPLLFSALMKEVYKSIANVVVQKGVLVPLVTVVVRTVLFKAEKLKDSLQISNLCKSSPLQ